MSRLFYGLLAALLFSFLGCQGEESKPPSADAPERPEVTQKDQKDSAPPDAAPPDDKASPDDKTPPDDGTPAVDVPLDVDVPADFSDIPAAPKGFTGKDQDAATPIEPEIQRKLKSYEDDYVDGLLELLNYPHPGVRQKAADRLGYLKDEDKDKIPQVVQALRGALKDPVPAVRQTAAYRLFTFGVQAKNALPELVPLMYDEDSNVVDSCMAAIGSIGPDAAPLVPQLIELLKKEKFANRGDAIDALAGIGPAAKPAAPLLVKMLDKFYISEKAGRALGRIGAEKELLQAMSDESTMVRNNAAEGAGLLGAHSAKMVAALIKMATSDDYEYARAEAAKSLGKVRPTTKQIVAALGQATKDEKETVRRDAAQALGMIDPTLEDAIPFLLAAAKDEDEYVRNAAATSLGKFQTSPESRLAALIDQLIADPDFLWSHQTQALKKGAAEFYPVLMKMAADEELDEVRRAAALLSLVHVFENEDFRSDEKKREVDALASSLMGDDQGDSVRGAAACLFRFSEWDRRPSSQQITASLAGLNGGKYVAVQTKCAAFLSRKRIKSAIPGLIEMAKDSDSRLRRAAAAGLEHFFDDAAPAIPVLIEIAKDVEATDRHYLISAIGKTGAKPDLSVPALTDLLDDEDKSIRHSAVVALARVISKHDLDAAAVVPKIIALMDAEKSTDKFRYLEALKTLGAKAAPAVDNLIPLLNEKYVGSFAAQALGAIGPDAAAAAPALIEAAVNWKKDRADALCALAEIKAGGAQFAKVAPKLLDDLDLRNYTLRALAAMGPDAAAAMPAVAKLLDSEDDYERSEAVKALAGMGEAAKAHLPKLKKMAAEDESSSVRFAATGALPAIAPDDPEVWEIAFASAGDLRDRDVKRLLETLGDRAPLAVKNALKSDKPPVRVVAVRLLPEVIDKKRAAPILTVFLDDQDAAVRQRAALQLHQLGHSSPKLAAIFLASLGGDGDWQMRSALRQQGRAVIRPLIDVILDPDKEVPARRAALEMLDDMKNQARIPTEKLKAVLASDTAQTRLWAAAALTLADLTNDASAPVFLEALKGDDEQQRIVAIRGLRRLWYDGNVIPAPIGAALVARLSSKNPNEAYEASMAIAHRKLHAQQLPAMLELLKDPDARTHGFTALAQGALVDAQLVPPMIEALKSDQKDQRQAAADALREQGEPAYKALLEVFLDGEAPDAVRSAAGKGLLTMRSEKPDGQTQEMVELLDSPQPHLRHCAAILLANWGHEWTPLKTSLLQALKSGEYQIRYAAVNALKKRKDGLRDAQSELIKMLASADENQRGTAANVLALAGDPSPEVIDALIQALLAAESHQTDIFTSALLEVKQMRPAGRAALLKAAPTATDEQKVKLLAAFTRLSNYPAEDKTNEIALARASLQSTNVALQRQAAITLAMLDPKSTEGAAILAKHFVRENGNVDYGVVTALRALGPQAKDAVPVLEKLLDDEKLADHALSALAAIGPDAAAAVPKAAELLAGQRTFDHAAVFLGNVGPAAGSAVPALVASLDNRSRMRAAAAALGKIDPTGQAVLPALFKHFKDPVLRYDAVAAVGGLGEAGRKAVPALGHALKRGDPELAAAAARSLGQLEQVAADSVDGLIGVLANEDDEVRAAAAGALGNIASHPDRSVPALIETLADKDETVRRASARALGRFKQDAAEAVPALAEALKDKLIQGSAAASLGEIGPAAKSAVPALMELAQTAEDLAPSQSNWNCKTAIDALGKIGPDAAAATPLLVKLHQTDNQYIKSACATALWRIDPAAAKKAGAEEPPREDG